MGGNINFISIRVSYFLIRKPETPLEFKLVRRLKINISYGFKKIKAIHKWLKCKLKAFFYDRLSL